MRYGTLFVLWAVLFALGLASLGVKLSTFLPAFLVIFVVTTALYFLGLWDQASRYNLEPPLVALGLGLLVSNTLGAPRWLEPALRVPGRVRSPSSRQRSCPSLRSA
ncbi:MAG: hypothetical protein M3O41_20910 [Pseudomonadota bacterium]|nr:hypothetical protein [Pseudomonadota bacterium]